MLNKIEIGSFIVETQKHLQTFDNPTLRYFKATLFAGRAGRILGKIRGHEVISNIDKIIQFGAETGEYDDQNILNGILPQIERYGYISIHRDTAGKIIKIEEDIPSENAILDLVSEMWQDRCPTIVFC